MRNRSTNSTIYCLQETTVRNWKQYLSAHLSGASSEKSILQAKDLAINAKVNVTPEFMEYVSALVGQDLVSPKLYLYGTLNSEHCWSMSAL